MSNRYALIYVRLIFVFFVCVSAASDYNAKGHKSSLESVAVLFRHGLRTPSKFYQSDPYKDVEKYWPIGLGQLTSEGKRQMYKLGKTFRRRYKRFVSKYEANSVRANSSDADRCHMSAASMLAGWFPPSADQLWSKALKWQPIPVHSVPAEQDRVLGLTAPCPKYDLEKEKVDKKIAANETKSDKRLFKYLTRYTEQNVSTTGQTGSIYKTLLLEEQNGYKLPSWTSRVYPEPMRKKAAIGLASWSWTTLMERITGGPMVKEIIDQFTLKSEGKNKKKKLFLYSGHEDTIIAVWRALGFKELLLPDFGASLIFELYKTGHNKHFVNMFYINNTSLLEPYQLKIPDCGSPCLLEDLSNLTKYMRAVDWNKDCSLT